MTYLSLFGLGSLSRITLYTLIEYIHANNLSGPKGRALLDQWMKSNLDHVAAPSGDLRVCNFFFFFFPSSSSTSPLGEEEGQKTRLYTSHH
jgi:hypothetical protein